MIAYVVVFLTSAGLAMALTPLSMRIARRWGIVARPGGRRIHRGEVPRLGGIVVLGAFLGGALISLAVRGWLPPPPEGPDVNEPTRFWATVIGTTLIGLFGLLDDRFELSAKPQYAVQIVVSIVAIVGLVFIERVRNPFTGELFIFPDWLVWGLTLFWLVGMMNTVNFLDGLNGLCAGISAIAATVMFVPMLGVGQYGPALLPLALLGAMLGFMPYNLSGRVFLGSGAITLGYLIGTLSLVAGARVATVALVMCIPVVDVAWQIMHRWRHGRSMNEGDRGHLHLRLHDLGLPQWQVVLLYWALCGLCGVLALLISPPIYKLVAIAGLGTLVLTVLAILTRRGDVTPKT